MTNGSRRKLTSAGIETVVSTGDLDGGLTAVNDPVLCAGAVAVVAEDSKSNSQSRLLVDVNVHLNGSAVGHDATLDIKTLAIVAIRVDAVTSAGWWGRRRGRSASVAEVPRAVKYTGVGGRAVGAGPGEVVKEGGGQVECAVRAVSGAL